MEVVMHIANVTEAKAHLSELIKRALAGDEVIIARSAQPLVKLTPIEQDLSPRAGGFWAGQVEVFGDWKEADNEIEALFAASSIFPGEDV